MGLEKKMNPHYASGHARINLSIDGFKELPDSTPDLQVNLTLAATPGSQI